MSREFDRNSYERNDRAAKTAITSYLIAGGSYDVEENPGVGVDLIVYNKGTRDCIGYVECERAETWWTYKGRYQGRDSVKGKFIRIPGRKKHYLSGKDAFDFNLGREADLPYGPKPVLFATVNSHCSDIMFIFSTVVKEVFWEEEDNCAGVRKGSKFMCIPLEKWSHGEIG